MGGGRGAAEGPTESLSLMGSERLAVSAAQHGEAELARAVAKICRRLGANPVTHLGLAGKELFHSNMLGWLFQQHYGPMCEVFEDLLAPDPTQTNHAVLREWNNLDLVVWMPGRRPLVVENKTFSLLSEEQLQRYSELAWIQDEDRLVLLSLADPRWTDREWTVQTPAGKRTWRWLPYSEVADRLRLAASAVGDSFERELIARYCRLIDDLVELSSILASQESDDAPVRLPDQVLTPLRKIRLGDGLLKLRSAAIASRIDPTHVSAGFTRGEPLIQAFSGADQRWLGWQLQGHQFRLCAIFGDLTGNSPQLQEARSREAKKLADEGVWFDFSELDRVLGSRAKIPARVRPDRNGFNKYNPDFVYRYRLVPDLTQGELITLGRFYRAAAESASRGSGSHSS
jgi:hypothetical protein